MGLDAAVQRHLDGHIMSIQQDKAIASSLGPAPSPATGFWWVSSNRSELPPVESASNPIKSLLVPLIAVSPLLRLGTPLAWLVILLDAGYTVERQLLTALPLRPARPLPTPRANTVGRKFPD